MKSIKYFALAFLIARAISTQAMNNNNNNQEMSPFAEISSKLQLQIATEFETIERELTQEVGNIFDKDMEKIIATLDNTNPEDTFSFPFSHCYKLGQTAFLVNQKLIEPTKTYYMPWGLSSVVSTGPSYFQDDFDCNQKDFYRSQLELGNHQSQKVDTLCDIRGKLADVILARAILVVSHTNNSGSPSDIRTRFIADYMSYFNTCRRKATEPVLEECHNHVNALNKITFDCTRENIMTLVVSKLTSNALSNKEVISQTPNYLLQKACLQYHMTKNRALIDKLAANATEYRRSQLYFGL